MSSNNKSNRLGNIDDVFIRPKKTVQDKLTPNEIKNLLGGYVEIKTARDLPRNTHIRYFSIMDDGKRVFRTGGYLINNKEYEKYIVLSNGNKTWSVNTQKSILFKKLSTEDITEVHDYEVSELKQIIKKLYKENVKLKQNC